MAKMKAPSQSGISIHGASGPLIKGFPSTARDWPDDFRDGDSRLVGGCLEDLPMDGGSRRIPGRAKLLQPFEKARTGKFPRHMTPAPAAA